MADLNPQEQQDLDEKRRRRAEALQTLARQANEQPALRESQERRPISTQKDWRYGARSNVRYVWLSAGIAVVMIAAVVGGMLLGFIPSPTNAQKPAPAMLRIDLLAMGYVCPAAMAWSSQGDKLAVLVQRGQITAASAQDPCGFSDTIVVFDAHTGKLNKAYPVGAVLKQDGAVLNIAFDTALSWSPDNSMIAVACAVVGDGSSNGVSEGVLLVPMKGGQPFIVHGFVSTAPDAPKSVVFNIRAQQISDSVTYPIQPASSYEVTATGQIDVERPLASATLDNSFTGIPIESTASRAAFWSSGALVGISPRDGSNAEVIYYTATVGLWSADSAYVDPALVLGAVGFAPDAEALAQMPSLRCAQILTTPCVATPISYADQALKDVQTQTIEESGVQPFATHTSPVAWRPDGKILATIYPADGFTLHSDTIRVTLLATNDAHVVKTLTTASNSSFNGGSVDLLSWSPTGHQLAFRDPAQGMVTLWGVSSL